MRVFWVILGVLMLAAAAYLMVSPRHSGEAGTTLTPAATTTQPQPAKNPDEAAQAPSAPPPVTPIVTQKPAPAPAESNAAAPPAGEPKPGPTPTPHEASPVAQSPASPATPPPAPTVEKPVEPPATPPATAPVEADPKIEKQPDGSMIVDGKYKVTGTGTEADPYKVTWDQLVSVQADYVPKEGRNRIPGRAKMLDGKWVEITGNIAFPLMAESADECLSMLNQWDGCCIGIPPTPYDAIEVRLKQPAEGKTRLATYGVMKGRMKVEPALVGGWLTGLYLMDRATMTPQGYGGFAP